jgi:hypothetical protein
MYLGILNNDMVGFANTTARDMLVHLFLSYGSITTVNLEHNWENMRKAWDPQQPVESLFGLLRLVPMKDVVRNRLWVQFPMYTVGFHHSGSHYTRLSPAHPPYGCLESMESPLPIGRRVLWLT